NGIVESKQPVVRSGERSNSPKTFCSAEDRPPAARRSAVCIMLEDFPAILHHQHRATAPALGIFCSTRAIGGLDCAECRHRCCKQAQQPMGPWLARLVVGSTGCQLVAFGSLPNACW